MSKNVLNKQSFEEFCKEQNSSFAPQAFVAGFLAHMGIAKETIDAALFGKELGNIAPNNRKNSFVHKDIAIDGVAYFRFPSPSKDTKATLKQMLKLNLVESSEHSFKLLICAKANEVGFYDLQSDQIMICPLGKLPNFYGSLTDILDISDESISPTQNEKKTGDESRELSEPRIPQFTLIEAEHQDDGDTLGRNDTEKKPAPVVYSGDADAGNKVILLVDALVNHNALEDNREKLGDFILRLWFCLFADDYKIFGEDDKPFVSTCKSLLKADGSNAEQFFEELFNVLATREKSRSKLKGQISDEILAFPYLEGDFFTNTIYIPKFNHEAVKRLLDCEDINWAKVSLVAFSSILPIAMVKAEERDYLYGTFVTERTHSDMAIRSYMAKIDRCFELVEETADNYAQDIIFASSSDECHTAASTLISYMWDYLEDFSELTFIDPACGCGNLLNYAYLSLRRLQSKVFDKVKKSIKSTSYGKKLIKAGAFEEYGINSKGHFSQVTSHVNVNNFYGIEIDPWLVKVSSLSLWMMRHICDGRDFKNFKKQFEMQPLNQMPTIICADALEIDWNKLCPAKACSYLISHLPCEFGHFMTSKQAEQHANIVEPLIISERPQYCCAWLVKAQDYMQANHRIEAAFLVPSLMPRFLFKIEDEFGQLLETYSELHIYDSSMCFGWPNIVGKNTLDSADLYHFGMRDLYGDDYLEELYRL